MHSRWRITSAYPVALEMPLAYLVVASMFLVALSGCIAPVEEAELEISIILDDDRYQRIQDVAGTVKIMNPGPTTAEATWICGGMIFSVQRIGDSEIIKSPAVDSCDIEGKPVPKRFEPGETIRKPFSLRWWEETENEFDLGTHGITVRPFRENWTSEQALFFIG